MEELPPEIIAMIIKKTDRKGALSLISSCTYYYALNWTFYDHYCIKFMMNKASECVFNSGLYQQYQKFMAKIKNIKNWTLEFSLLPPNITGMTIDYDIQFKKNIYDSHINHLNINIRAKRHLMARLFHKNEFPKNIKILEVKEETYHIIKKAWSIPKDVKIVIIPYTPYEKMFPHLHSTAQMDIRDFCA